MVARGLQSSPRKVASVGPVTATWHSASIPGATTAAALQGNDRPGMRRIQAALARSVVAPPDYAGLRLDLPDERYNRLDASYMVDLASSFGHEDPYLSSALQGASLAARARRTQDPAMHWGAFSAAVSPHLRSVHPILRWHPSGRVVPAWRVRRLVDIGVAALLGLHGVQGEVVELCGAPHNSTLAYRADSEAHKRSYGVGSVRRPPSPSIVPFGVSPIGRMQSIFSPASRRKRLQRDDTARAAIRWAKDGLD